MFRYRIPRFYGVFDKREFQEWLANVDDFFEFVDVELTKRAFLVASRFRGYVTYWWERLQNQRVAYGKREFLTWGKMKIKMKEEFLPFWFDECKKPHCFQNVVPGKL